MDNEDWTIGIDIGAGDDRMRIYYMPGKDQAGDWMAYNFLCRICAHRWRGVIPESADEDNVECPGCHNMTGEPEEYEGDGDCGPTA